MTNLHKKCYFSIIRIIYYLEDFSFNKHVRETKDDIKLLKGKFLYLLCVKGALQSQQSINIIQCPQSS